MTADDWRVVAILTLTAWCYWWIIRDKLHEDHTDPEPSTVRAEHDDELARLLAASDTPIHDAAWVSRLRADIDQWGRP